MKNCSQYPSILRRMHEKMDDIISADLTVDCAAVYRNIVLGYVLFIVGISLLVVYFYALRGMSHLPVVSILLIVIALRLIYDLDFKIRSHKKARESEAENELPYVALLFAVATALGQSIYNAIKMLYNFSSLDRSKRDFKFLYKIMLFKRVSMLEAMNYLAQTHPSFVARNFYRTIVATERAGGDKYTFYYGLTTSMMRLMRDRIERIIERFNMFINVFIIIYVLIPMGIIIVYSLFSGNQGLAPVQIVALFYPLIASILLMAALGKLVPVELRDPVPMSFTMKLGIAVLLVAGGLFAALYRIVPIEMLYLATFASIFIPLLIIQPIVARRINYYKQLDNFVPFFARYIENGIKKGNHPIQILTSLVASEQCKQEEKGGDKETCSGMLDKDIRKMMLDIFIKIRLQLGVARKDTSGDYGPFKRAIKDKNLPWPLTLVFEYLDIFSRLGSEPRSVMIVADFIENLYAVKRILAERGAAFISTSAVALIIMTIGYVIVNNNVLPQLTTLDLTAMQQQGPLLRVSLNPVTEDLLPYIKQYSYINVIITATLLPLVVSKISRGTILYGFQYSLVLVTLITVIMSLMDRFTIF